MIQRQRRKPVSDSDSTKLPVPAPVSQMSLTWERDSLASDKERQEQEKSLVEYRKTISDLREKYYGLSKRAESDTQEDILVSDMSRSLLATVLTALPVAAEYYAKVKSDKAAYALAALVTQSRELGRDIKANQHKEAQVEHISQKIVDVALTSFIRQVLNRFLIVSNQITADFNLTETDRPALNRIMGDCSRDVGSMITEISKMINQQLSEYLIAK